MRLDTVLIADAVSIPGDGKFYIHGGGYSRIEITGTPVPIPISVFARFLVEDGDEKLDHRFCFTLIGPAGVPNVFPVEGSAVPPAEDPSNELLAGEQQFLDVAIEIPAVALLEGLYRLQIELHGELVREIPFPVVVVNRPSKQKRKKSKPASGSKKARAKKPPPPPRKQRKRR